MPFTIIGTSGNLVQTWPFPNGSQATPSMSFVSASNSGFFNSGGNVAITVLGTERAQVTTQGIYTSGNIVGNLSAGNIVSGVLSQSVLPQTLGNSTTIFSGASSSLTGNIAAGNLSVAGNVQANGITATNNITAYASDKRLKSNIIILSNAIAKLSHLHGVSFEWREDTPQPMRGRDIGLIAQDVQKVLPEAVHPAPFDTNSDGSSRSGESYLTIDVVGNKLIALLVEAVKELSMRVSRLEKNTTIP